MAHVHPRRRLAVAPLARQIVLAAAVLAPVLAPAMTAGADIVKKQYAFTIYDYLVTHMPDLDQRRLGLSGAGGMHCVPTSSMNLWCYAAKHGFPFIAPGPIDHQSNANHETLTDSIFQLGQWMSTSGVDGTSSIGNKQGMATFNLAYGGLQFAIQHRYHCDDVPAHVDRIAKAGSLGAILRASYGRYALLGVDDDFRYIVERDGGHSVTVVGASRVGEERLLLVRDPATDDNANLESQSEFTSRELEIESRRFSNLGEYELSYFGFDYDAASVRIFDSYTSVRPLAGLKWRPSGAGSAAIESAATGSFGGIPLEFGFTGPVFDIIDLVFDSDALDALALVIPSSGAASEVRRIDFATGTSATVGTVSGLRQIATGRDGQIYGHDGARIYCIRANGTLTGSLAPEQGAPTAIAFDDANEHVVVVSRAGRSVTRLNRWFGFVSTVSIPQWVGLGDDITVSVGDLDGAVYFLTKGDRSIVRLGPGGTQDDFSSIAIAGIDSFATLRAGDHGRLYATSEGVLRVLTRDQKGRWVIDVSSPFDGREFSVPFDMMRSRDNYRPELNSGPRWRNLLPEQLGDGFGRNRSDCLSDLDYDRAVNSADLALLLGAWGSSDGRYDINLDGTVNSADLAALLGAWGSCD